MTNSTEPPERAEHSLVGLTLLFCTMGFAAGFLLSFTLTAYGLYTFIVGI